MFAELVSMLTTVLVYLSLLLVGFWVWFHWSHRDLLRVAAKVPVSLPTVPLLGHTYLTFWGLEETARSVVEMTVSVVEKGIRTVCFWCGPLPLICIGDVDDIQILLTGTNVSDKAEEYDYFTAGFESGAGQCRHNILSARGQIWKLTRKHLNPMFHPQNVQHLVPVFNMNSRELVARMHEHVMGGSFNVMEYTMDVGLKTICNLIFGPDVQIDVESESFKGLMSVVESIPEMFIKRVLRPWLRVGWVFQLLYRSHVKQMNANWVNFTETPLKVIKKKKAHQTQKESLKERKDRSPANENQEQLNLLDVYSILRQRYPEFTEADMRSEMLALYCTGTDTIGSGTASCLLALAQYQDIQERLYREIVSVVGTEDDVILEDLVRMPYLDQVIKETLRRFLIVPYLLRKVTKDVKLSTCTIPAGSSVVCNIAAIHMDPNIYKNPKNFDPDRFSPENLSGKDKFTFVPFSGGPRMCIAKTYAMQLMKIQIIHVLRNFRVTTNQDIHNLKKKLIVTLVNTEGYNICVKNRILDKTIVGSD